MPHRPGLTVAVAGLLLASIALSITWLLAELASNRVRGELARWNAVSAAPSSSVWDRALADAGSARKFSGNPADSLFLLASLYEWRPRPGAAALLDPSVEAASRRQAIESYRQSIAARPAWPDSWIFLARQKALAGELDEELRNALHRALELGRNERRIHSLAIEVIGLSWPFFAGDQAIINTLQ